MNKRLLLVNQRANVKETYEGYIHELVSLSTVNPKMIMLMNERDLKRKFMKACLAMFLITFRSRFLILPP